MGRKDNPAFALLQKVEGLECAYPVGVDHEGAVQLPVQPPHRLRLRVPAETRPHHDHVPFRNELPDRVIRRKRKKPTPASSKGNVIASVSFVARMALRLAGMTRVTRPAPIFRAAGRHRGSARFACRACNHGHVPEHPLMRISRARPEKAAEHGAVDKTGFVPERALCAAAARYRLR